MFKTIQSWLISLWYTILMITNRQPTPSRRAIQKVLELNLELWMVNQKLRKALFPHVLGAKHSIPPKGKSMATLNDALTELTATVAESNTTVDLAIAALKAGTVTPAQVQSITDASAAVNAKTAELKDALANRPQ